MNIFTKPKLTPGGKYVKGPGALFVDMYGPDDPRWGQPPRQAWRIVDGEWKLVSLVRPDGTLEPLPGLNGPDKNETKAKQKTTLKSKKKKK